ncbi:MAG: hypothetical protein WCV83_00925 [Candidatus Magasanikbacteria bacterium]|jgi:hypothetical protein
MDKLDLKKAVLRTLAYFDLSDYPLTVTEIKNWLYHYEVQDYFDLLTVLEEMKNQKQVEEKFSYFYLPNREMVVENRRQNLVIAELKLGKARRAAKFIRSVPFLKAIFVCNTVAAGTAAGKSDIDFFIIAQAKRVWLVRFFTNLILRLFNLRTYGDNNRDKICLSFFVDDNNLNLQKLKACEEDIHFAYWITQMVPIFDLNNYWKSFLSANYWLKDYFPNLLNNFIFQNLVEPGSFAMVWKKTWEIMWFGAYGDLLEKQARDWQMLKMKLSTKEKAGQGDNGIVLNEGVIKLHENDTRIECAKQWEEKSTEILNMLCK